MVSIDRLLAFALASFVLIVIPGPSVLFVVGRALAHGRRTALATVLGNAAGMYVLAAAVAAGLGAIMERSEAAFTTVKLAGAAYLVWLGVRAIRHRDDLVGMTAAVTAPRSGWRAAREGFLVAVTNPKGMILFAAILPQFVDRSASDVPGQMLVLALVSVVIAVVSDSGWALAASGVRSWFARSPRRLSRVGGVGGLMLIGLGIGVAATGRAD
jgi:threonine/homoserine/homoserine lactone efflux protein